MAYQIIIKKRFTKSVHKVLSFLQKEWSDKVAGEFLKKLDYRILLLTKQAHIGTRSSKVKDVRGLLITRQNKLYYKIKGNKIIILNMYDTQIDPRKMPY